MIRLQAYITSDIRWHQTHPHHADGAGKRKAGDLSVRSCLGDSNLSLEAVLGGKRLPVTLHFDDNEDPALDNAWDLSGGTASDRESSGRLPPGVQAVILEVDIGNWEEESENAAIGYSHRGTVDSTEAGQPKPGLLRINVWRSLNGTEHGGGDGDCSPGHDAQILDICGTPAKVSVYLPDVLMASEQVVLVPRLWALGACDLSRALAQADRAARANQDGSLSDSEACCRPSDKALSEVALVIEAVFAAEYPAQGEARAKDSVGTLINDEASSSTSLCHRPAHRCVVVRLR